MIPGGNRHSAKDHQGYKYDPFKGIEAIVISIKGNDNYSYDRSGAEEHHVCPINGRALSTLVMVHVLVDLNIQKS